jgi:tetratricopeptide (TPR) repeat protein
MLRLALEDARTPLPEAALEERLRGLADQVLAGMGDAGRTERAAHESLLLSHRPVAVACRTVVFRDPQSRMIGGCRLRYAQALEAAGEIAAARVQFEEALRDIVWLRFGYLDLVPEAAVGLARCLEALGQADEARAAYERLVGDFRLADRELPAVLEANRALARLALARKTPAADAP